MWIVGILKTNQDNMKTIFAICSLVCFSFVANTQNYFDYHRKINKAEKHIAKEEFEQAIPIYQEVFDSFNFIFIKDALIAGQIAVFVEQDSIARTFVERALKGGYELPCLMRNQYLKQLVDDSLKMVAKEVRKEYFKSIDYDLLKETSSRYQEEQVSYVEAKEFYTISVRGNYKLIKQFTEKNGFPGDQLIGIDYPRLAKKMKACTCGNEKIIETLMTVDFPISEMWDHWRKAIEDGMLHPREFVHLFIAEKTRKSMLYLPKLQRDPNKSRPLLPDFRFNFPGDEIIRNLSRVDRDRREWGVCSYGTDIGKEEVAKKYNFQFYYGYR